MNSPNKLPLWLQKAIEPHPSLAGPAPVPAQFAEASLERIPSQALRGVLERYGRDFWQAVGGGAAPLLIGPPGTWKSYAAAVFVKRLHEKACIRTHWCTVPVALTKLERNRFAPTTDAQLEEWKQSPFLVCDDFGMVRLNSWQHDVLIEVAMHRFDAQKPTFWTGNVVAAPGKKDLLVDVVGAQLARRILERSEGYRLYVQEH